jgi:pyridoxamine 5'-phosphate oxidase
MSAGIDDGLRENLRQMRRSYGDLGLPDQSLPEDPLTLFGSWLNEASANPYIVEPNAMVLGTSDLSSRTVLLKDLSGDGFTFFTNYESRKARAIAHDPRTTLLFPWYAMERQVIVIGDASRVDESESDLYFASRPYGSQIGAWASEQSREIDSREQLEKRFNELQSRYKEGEVPRPPHWGGFRVKPASIEFWQGRYSRLHDRIRYTRDDHHWKWVRLNP